MELNTACMKEPEIFFPAGYLGKPDPGDPEGNVPLDYHSEDAERARGLCAKCPLLEQCLEDAKIKQPGYGIQAGLDPNEIIREVAKDALRLR